MADPRHGMAPPKTDLAVIRRDRLTIDAETMTDLSDKSLTMVLFHIVCHWLR